MEKHASSRHDAPGKRAQLPPLAVRYYEARVWNFSTVDLNGGPDPDLLTRNGDDCFDERCITVGT
jgi:hypothetical protein